MTTKNLPEGVADYFHRFTPDACSRRFNAVTPSGSGAAATAELVLNGVPEGKTVQITLDVHGPAEVTETEGEHKPLTFSVRG
uniref:hypothetical protein n=1 Tax=Streptomyces achromogenes TaxID=67255 RepID=UPI003F4952A1